MIYKLKHLESIDIKQLNKAYEYFEIIYTNPEDLANLVSTIMKSFGHNNPNPKMIGEGGGNGDIYNLGNKILKMTKDEVESANAYHISKIKNLKYFIKYFEVRAIKLLDPKDIKITDKFKTKQNNGEPVQKTLYAITMEELNVLKEGTEEYKTLSSVIHCFVGKHKKLGDTPQFTNHGLETYDEFLKLNSEEIVKNKLIEKKITNMDMAMGFYKELILLMKEAKENGILIGDADSGNFGYNSNKQLVIFDLGGMGNTTDECKNELTKAKIIEIPSLESLRK